MSSKRERDLARLRAERLAAKQAAAAKSTQRHRLIALSTVGVLLVGAAVVGGVLLLSGDDDSDAVVAGGCTWTPTGKEPSRPVELPPTEPIALPAEATMATNRGTLAFTLSPDAPCAATSVASLARQGFYDNTSCHRLTTVEVFILQCGDPEGTGLGGPGYEFAAENLPMENPDAVIYPAGTVAMAKSQATGTSGSQFFLVYQDSPLPPVYTVLGQLTRGLDVIEAVGEAGAEPADESGNTAPKAAVSIASLRTSPVTPEPPSATPSEPAVPSASVTPSGSATP